MLGCVGIDERMCVGAVAGRRRGISAGFSLEYRVNDKLHTDYLNAGAGGCEDRMTPTSNLRYERMRSSTVEL